jgi:murein DD-endopeptidase MepM/ murein hydrolase activator NlpD
LINTYYKRIFIGVIIAFGVVFFVGLTSLVKNFPNYYPDHTLLIEGKILNFLQEITLPIKIARLSIKDPDSQILMPVYGRLTAQIADTWQAPRGNDRMHEGQDVFASRGTPVFSGTHGYVVRMKENSDLGGNYISIIGAGGRRYYYAHLNRFAGGIKPGSSVTTDTVIGFVGNTGNANTTPTHLHFGVYVLRKAIDPLPLMINRSD